MSDLTVTVSGWVATEPRSSTTTHGDPMLSFRLANTSRYFNREQETWVDGKTEWFTVRCFRKAATLVGDSVRKGQPVLVRGRLSSSTWEYEEEKRFDLVIDAQAIGHDLTKGTADFVRTPALGSPAHSEAADSSSPLDDSGLTEVPLSADPLVAEAS